MTTSLSFATHTRLRSAWVTLLVTAACGAPTEGMEEDLGVVLIDAAPAADMPPLDSGATDEETGGGVCPPFAVPAPEGQACDAVTQTCLANVTTFEEQVACFEADATPDACRGCIFQSLSACATAPGGPCGQLAGDFQCCIDDRCSGLDGDGLRECVLTECREEGTASDRCIGAFDGRACALLLDCFRP